MNCSLAGLAVNLKVNFDKIWKFEIQIKTKKRNFRNNHTAHRHIV